MKALIFVSLFLPALTAADTFIFHCPLGCPNNPDGNDLLIKHTYALSNDGTTKFADWVAYVVDVRNYGEGPGRAWKADPHLDPGVTLEPSPRSENDYRGANQAIKVDRGHQAPLASFAGHRHWYETNQLSNITPQRSNLNQGPWMRLEVAVRDASKFRDPMYVITGPLYESDETPMPNAEPHKVPSGYFKIVYDKKGNAAAFIMDQELVKTSNYCDQSATVAQVASRSALTMPTLTISTAIRGRLGCG